MSNSPQDPAFPRPYVEVGTRTQQTGMSYRDWLLGQVAAGVVERSTANIDDPVVADAVAHETFQVVDALLRERKRRWV